MTIFVIIKIIILIACLKFTKSLDFIDLCESGVMVKPCLLLDRKRYYYDADSNECMEYEEGLCGMTDNKFETKEKCMETCFEDRSWCVIKEKSRKCGANDVDMYYFNSRRLKCEQFPAGECGVTRNRFDTLENCQKTCEFLATDLDLCNVEPASLKCGDGDDQKYYYDSGSNKCKKFEKNKCGVTYNRFSTMKECKKTCKQKKKICRLKKKSGKCSTENKHTFYYDSKTGKCSKFKKNKCGRNSNKFLTLEDCEKNCPTIHRLPKRVVSQLRTWNT